MPPERSSRNCWSLCSTIGNPPFQSAFGSRTVTYQSEIRPLPISHMLYFPSRYMATANTTRRFSNWTALAGAATPRPWFSSLNLYISIYWKDQKPAKLNTSTLRLFSPSTRDFSLFFIHPSPRMFFLPVLSIHLHYSTLLSTQTNRNPSANTKDTPSHQHLGQQELGLIKFFLVFLTCLSWP